jgi:hypothetical protein
MRELAADGKIDINGDTSKGWKDFEVKLKTAATEDVPLVQSND